MRYQIIIEASNSTILRVDKRYDCSVEASHISEAVDKAEKIIDQIKHQFFREAWIAGVERR